MIGQLHLREEFIMLGFIYVKCILWSEEMGKSRVLRSFQIVLFRRSSYGSYMSVGRVLNGDHIFQFPEKSSCV